METVKLDTQRGLNEDWCGSLFHFSFAKPLQKGLQAHVVPQHSQFVPYRHKLLPRMDFIPIHQQFAVETIEAGAIPSVIESLELDSLSPLRPKGQQCIVRVAGHAHATKDRITAMPRRVGVGLSMKML